MTLRYILQFLGAQRSNGVEALLVLAAVGLALALPEVGSKWFEKIEQRFSRLARIRWRSALLIGLLALGGRAALLPLLPIPQPVVHDEFSYLLAAGTFAHGRITNPTHPMWVHFESYDIIQKPTYMSKYPPAQGLILAAGRVVAGNPFWGLWLSLGLMCGAICWMLQAWMPAGWALLGAGLVTYRLAFLSYWGDSYWGGAVAATGGALVLGALPRLMRRPRVRIALLMGVGLAIVANSRPYEGAWLGLAVALALLAWVWGKNRPSLGVAVGQVILPLLLVLLATGCLMAYYFWRATGSPFRSPYRVYMQTYLPATIFPWQPVGRMPEFHHEELRNNYLGWVDYIESARSHPGQLVMGKAYSLLDFFLGPTLVAPVLLLLLVGGWGYFRSFVKSRKARLLLLLCGLPLLGMALPIYFNPHYVAPLTGALYAMVLLAMRHLRLWRWRGQPVGRQMVRGFLCVIVAMFLGRTVVHSLYAHGFAFPWRPAINENVGRSRILEQLGRYPGGQLVVVRDCPTYSADLDWVYNDADIGAAKVVWARDMGFQANEELIRYFQDRRAWLLEACDSSAKLLPYPTMDGNEEPSARVGPLYDPPKTKR